MRSVLNLFLVAVLASPAIAQQAAPPAAPAGPGLTVTSTSFEDGGVIPDKYTQKATPFVSPEVEWKFAPAAVVSYTLIMHDPEAAPQKNSADVLHWMVFNIPAGTTSLPEGASGSKMPEGAIEGKSTRGTAGFLGPGAGAAGPYHHYTIELYALDTKLSLAADATRDDVLKAMNGHVIAKGATVGRFHR
jgi:Raf kinase inhibitor-like YbhB/YbcL family protein